MTSKQIKQSNVVRNVPFLEGTKREWILEGTLETYHGLRESLTTEKVFSGKKYVWMIGEGC